MGGKKGGRDRGGDSMVRRVVVGEMAGGSLVYGASVVRFRVSDLGIATAGS